MTRKSQKLYVVRKYILARSAKEALRKELKQPADEVWVDESFKNQLPSAIGFNAESDEIY